MRISQRVEAEQRRIGNGTLGQQSDELARPHFDPALGSRLPHARDDVSERRLLRVDHVDRDLHLPARREQQPERLHAGHATTRLPHRSRDRLRILEATRAELDVERDQQGPGADQHRTGPRVERRRAKRGPQLATVDAPLQLRRPTLAEEGGSHAVGALAVEKHRQPELAPDALAELERNSRARCICEPTSGTIGTTSAAPTRGWIPTCSRRSISSAARAIPAKSAEASSPSSATIV